MNEKIKKAFDNLIGCQIIDITENSITVRKRDELYELIGYEDTYDISFDKYDGDCCGYAEITKELFLSRIMKTILLLQIGLLLKKKMILLKL